MSRRLSNGRSPLVRKQSQITAFFSTPPSKPSPTATDPVKAKPKITIPPSPVIQPTTQDSGSSLSHAPPSSLISSATGPARVKPKITVPHSPAIKPAVQDSDGTPSSPPRKLRRLRRLSQTAGGSTDDGSVEEEGLDDGDDEEWVAKKEDVDEDEGIDADNGNDDEEEVVVSKSRRGNLGRNVSSAGSASSNKRKRVEVENMACTKKFSFAENGEEDEKMAVDGKSRLTHCKGEIKRLECDGNSSFVNRLEVSGKNGFVDASLTGEVAERFGKRDHEKFRFLREGRKDSKGKRPGDIGYDSRTAYIPPEFLRSLSGGQKQWWEFKSKNMDKVIFFKMGKFYELFEMDAHVGARELDLQYMKGDQPHCGFPEKNFSVNLEKLARKGYRVLVVEQTETPEQLELRRKETNSKDKVVKREICAVVTKGTLMEGESLLTIPDASYLLSVTENHHSNEELNKEDAIIGICLVDVSTSKFIIGQFPDDSERHCLCSILSELRPVEIIKPMKMLSPETERVLRNNTRLPLVNELVPLKEFWGAEKTIDEIKRYYSSLNCSSSDECNELCMVPSVLADLITRNGSYALSSLGGCLHYLRQAFLDEKLLRCAEFEPLSCLGLHKDRQKHMILDAAALENLELLENLKAGTSSGTLYAQLDHCITAFGKRFLKSLIARPLYDSKLIMERQDAIATFKGAGLTSALGFRKELSGLPDMERLLSRLFASCDGKGRNSTKVVLYEDAAKKQVKEFTAALRGCQQMLQACGSLDTVEIRSGSSLLAHLLTPGKGMPEVSSILDHFKNAFDWSEADQTGRIIPSEGCDSEVDDACSEIRKIEAHLAKHLKEQQKLLGDSSIKYVSVGKDSYLIEIPEDLSGSVPRSYELQASKRGYNRYWTPEVKELLSELSQAEAEKENKLKGILHRLIQKFSEHHNMWRKLVSAISELDVLISLAIASDYFEGPTCRPVIREPCSAVDTPTLFARSLGHPVLRSDALGKGSFVPNDVRIGGLGNANFVLLTGPNMGGKSTLLRQVCMAVILAQIGADVPAESFELSLVDRIFVRMGARDHIMAGQSTFLMELTETASMLSLATRNSLVALDELGRGTSTSDGQAIAASVLEYLVRVVQCRGLFSTHYHRLAVEYEKDVKIALYHMACQVGIGDGGLEEVTFLYRLASGSCPKSYGINVARLAGMPASVLQKAVEKSTNFESNYGKRHNKELASIQHLFNVLVNTPVCLSTIHEVQKNARLLLKLADIEGTKV